MEIINVLPNDSIKEDYKHGALNILWLVKNGIRTIIFAYIELLPNEFPEPIEIEESEFCANTKLKQRLYFIRVKSTAKELIAWYEKALKGEVLTMFWQDDEQFSNIEYESEPLYPKMSVSNNTPFVGDHSGCVRCSFLFEKDLSGGIKDLCSTDKSVEWINSQLKFDISRYPEYLGCIGLVAYNPLIRSISTWLVKNEKTNFESVSFHIEQRSDANISELQFIYAEKRYLGYSSLKIIKLDKPSFILEDIGEIGQIGHAIICPQRGLLLWDGFHAFMKSITMNMNIVTGKNVVSVPSKDLKSTEDTYEKNIYFKETTRIGKEKHVKSESLSSRLINSKFNREKIEKSQNSQKLFYDSPKEATLFVRELISKTNKRVVIIDPYITVRELFNFVLSVNSSVDVTIMTSALGWGRNKFKSAKLLLKNIQNCANVVKINVYVMKGSQPAFHDRFIIIDNKAWLSGNSLADIGKRASILMECPDPDPILKIYHEVVSDTQKAIKLEDWIKNNEENSTNKSN